LAFKFKEQYEVKKNILWAESFLRSW